MDERVVYAALALAAGVLVGAVGTSIAIGPPADRGTGLELGEDPPYSYSTGGSSPAAGWLHEVQIDDRMVITGNASMTHAPDQDLRLLIEAAGGDRYVMRFQRVQAEGPTKGNGTQVTTVQWGTSLPRTYGTLEIWVDGEHLRTIENDEATTPRLFALPNPLNASA